MFATRHLQAARPLGSVPCSTSTGAAKRSRNYFLVLLTAAFVLNFFDRSIVNVLLDSIKAELKLSDTALGFIAGLGFVLLYALLGVPLARLADVRGRRGVVACGIFLWSIATALGGLAQSGTQLALARTGVGIGEAAGTAPSVAMMADLFTKDERPRALSILNLGVPLGVFFGIMVGGLANNWFGWRAALFIAGVPGLIVAALLATAGPPPRIGIGPRRSRQRSRRASSSPCASCSRSRPTCSASPAASSAASP